MMTIKRLLLITALIFAGHCFAAETTLQNQALKKTAEKTKIILIEPDVELAQVLTSGVTETRADWSKQGMTNTQHWLNQYFASNDLDFTDYNIPEGEEFSKQRQIRALHGAVGQSILSLRTRSLPTKKDFDWTLGTGASSLQIDGADYGLFLYLRRGYGTGGRIALSVATTILFGAVPVISYQFAFASLVDLETGQIVWFNDLRSIVGDLRDQDKAEKTIHALLTDFPQLELPEIGSINKSQQREEAAGRNCVSC